MSVIVLGIEMPENCHVCGLCFGGLCFAIPPEVDVMCPDEGRPDWCPLRFPRINPMPKSPGDGAERWRCESCVYYPPSSFGGKPCSYCWEGDPYLDQYVPGDGAQKEKK